MSDAKTDSLRDMVGTYLALARKAARYWRRAAVLFTLVAAAGIYWAWHKPRVYRVEASAAVHDVRIEAGEAHNQEEAQAELKAKLDQIYGSRANMGRVADELGLYPWLRGRTSRLKLIESFQDALTYTASGRDAFKLEFVYADAAAAKRAVERLLRLYTEERRESSALSTRNDLASVNTALAGLETVLADEEDRLERFERANHESVEQVRLRRLGQQQARLGAPVALAAAATVVAEPGESTRTRRLRVRLAGLQSRAAALQRSLDAPVAAPAAAPAAPVEESERVTTLRHAATELRERLARLRTTYTDEYPDVQVARARLADAERDLEAAVSADRARVRGAASATPAPAAAAPAQVRAQLADIAREADQTRGELAAAAREDRAQASAPRAPTAPAAAVPAAAVPAAPAPAVAAVLPEDRPLGSLVEVEQSWDRLIGELGTTRTRYQQLLGRKFELQASLDTVNTTGADVLRVIDPPVQPTEPEPPGRTRLAMMALAAALVLALGVAVLSAILDTRVYEPADLRRWGELPELPAIPDLRPSAEPRVRRAS